MMNRKKKKELRQRQSTRQLMGIVKIRPTASRRKPVSVFFT